MVQDDQKQVLVGCEMDEGGTEQHVAGKVEWPRGESAKLCVCLRLARLRLHGRRSETASSTSPCAETS